MAYRSIGRRIERITVVPPRVATVSSIYEEMSKDFEAIMSKYRVEPTYRMIYRSLVLRWLIDALLNRVENIKRTYELAIRAGLRKDVVDELMNLVRRYLSKYIKVTF